MMNNDRNSWQYGQAGSYVTDTGGDEEVLLSRPTILPNFDWQPLEGESWQFPVDSYASLLHSDKLEDPQPTAFSSGPFESIENAIPRTNCPELRNQFRLVLNGNSYASSESWKNLLVVGDGDVETSPDPENLGMCSRANQGPLPERNHKTAARTGQNLKPRRNQKKIDGVKNSKTGRRPRGPNWSPEESRLFLQQMEVQKGMSPWKAISDSLKAMGFVREAKACEDHWGVLLADLKKFQNHFESDDILRDLHFWSNVGTMSREERSQNRLPLVFEEEWFEAIARIVEERSKHRKSRREHSKGRIHDVAGTPSCSSCRQQSRVSAASVTPSAEIFNSLAEDGDGIIGLVKLLGSTDRNGAVDQTILEVMRIRLQLEAQKLDLRGQEIQLERERIMYQGQRNGLITERARRPPAAHEWN